MVADLAAAAVAAGIRVADSVWKSQWAVRRQGRAEAVGGSLEAVEALVAVLAELVEI